MGSGGGQLAITESREKVQKQVEAVKQFYSPSKGQGGRKTDLGSGGGQLVITECREKVQKQVEALKQFYSPSKGKSGPKQVLLKVMLTAVTVIMCLGMMRLLEKMKKQRKF